MQAYDVAALYYRGRSAELNFQEDTYDHIAPIMAQLKPVCNIAFRNNLAKHHCFRGVAGHAIEVQCRRNSKFTRPCQMPSTDTTCLMLDALVFGQH
jgi:hypothetical protein